MAPTRCSTSSRPWSRPPTPTAPNMPRSDVPGSDVPGSDVPGSDVPDPLDLSDLRGAGVSPGVGAGPVRTLGGSVPEPPEDEQHGGDAAAERDRAQEALHGVADD